MKKQLKKVFSVAFVAIMVVVTASCGANFNTVGTTIGNLENSAEVTSQGNNTFYIHDGDIYKTDDITKEGKMIYEGDVSCINITGEKIYFYDNEISTICKSNTEGDKIDRIAEIYCDKFVVVKDNIYANILTGSGSNDMTDPDNYNIVKMKTTDRKLRSTMPKVAVEKAKLVGAVGDMVYVEKKTETGKAIYEVSLDGETETKLLDVPADANIAADANGFVLTGTVNGQYGLYSYTKEGKLDKLLSALTKNPTGNNAVNMDGETVYYENYAVGEGGVIADNLLSIKKDGTDVKQIATNAKNMEYKIAIGSGGVMVKAKEAGNLDENPRWTGVKAQ